MAGWNRRQALLGGAAAVGALALGPRVPLRPAGLSEPVLVELRAAGNAGMLVWMEETQKLLARAYGIPSAMLPARRGVSIV